MALTFGKGSWDQVRNSLSLYFGLSNNVCLLDWSTVGALLLPFTWTDDIAGASFPWVYFPKWLLPSSWKASQLPAMKSWLTVLGRWTTHSYRDCHKAGLPSPFRPLFMTCLIMPVPWGQLSNVYRCFCELFMCHCVTEGWFISHGTHPIRKAPLLPLAVKLILHSLF